jgi:hypothetical protein
MYWVIIIGVRSPLASGIMIGWPLAPSTGTSWWA